METLRPIPVSLALTLNWKAPLNELRLLQTRKNQGYPDGWLLWFNCLHSPALNWYSIPLLQKNFSTIYSAFSFLLLGVQKVLIFQILVPVILLPRLNSRYGAFRHPFRLCRNWMPIASALFFLFLRILVQLVPVELLPDLLLIACCRNRWFFTSEL